MMGTPAEMSPFGPDPSIVLMTGYLFGVLGLLIVLALAVGLVTLPVFFAVLFAVEQVARAAAERTGAFAAKLVLIMFRGLRRSPLRTSLTYLALFILTIVLTFIYSILSFIATVTTEKEANFKAIVTHRTTIPSQMPPSHYDEIKRLALGLPDGMRPVNGEDDVMSWSFVGGTTEKASKKPENTLFMFGMEPRKILTMMDGLDDLTGAEKELVARGVEAMEKDPQAIVVSKTRLRKMNLRVGQKVTLYGLNYPDLVFDFRIVGTLPDGKYEGVGFMSKKYLDDALRSYKDPKTLQPHPMANKCINLIWIRLPTRDAFGELARRMNESPALNSTPVKLETASSGIGTWLDSLKDIFFGMKYILCPAMVAIMSLVVANAISIGVRERRTEMAVLKVLGFQPRHVMALVLGEAVLVGLLAGGMSSLIAWAAIGKLKFQLAFFGAFFVPWQALIYGPLLGVAVALAGSVGPALSAKRVRVAEVFAKTA